MLGRRGFLAAIAGAFVPIKKTKAPLPDGLCVFSELPEKIESMAVFGNELFVLCASGIYKVFEDGRYKKLSA